MFFKIYVKRNVLMFFFLIYFSVLFRENKRLANKLTKDELTSLKTYINDRLIQENQQLIFEYNALQSSYNATLGELRQTVETLQKELLFKNDIIHNYKSSEENLSSVYKKRGDRLEKRHSILLEDHEANTETVKLFELRANNLQNELEDYQQKVEEQTKVIEDSGETIKRLQESQDNVINSEKLAKDLLKVKLTVDDKEREFQRLKRQNEELSQQIETYKTKCSSVQQKMEKMQEDFQNQTKDFRSKCESVAQLQYQIDLEKKKTSDLQKELHVLQEDIGISRNNQSEPNSTRNNRDFSSYKAESMRSQIQLLEGRVKLVEERLSLYRTSVRDATKEVGIISKDCKHLEQLVDRLVVHESTEIEKMLLELRKSTETRRCVLEESIDGVNKQAPAIISRDAVEIRAEVTTLKKQAEVGKLNDVIMRCSRLFPRIEACERAQFDKIVNRQWKESATPPRQVAKPRKSIDHTNTTFSGLPKKPPVVPLLLRSKTQNGNLSLWKRKHSVSMDSVLVSPTLIDLSVSASPSPRPTLDTRARTFFPPGRPLSAFSNSSVGKQSQ